MFEALTGYSVQYSDDGYSRVGSLIWCSSRNSCHSKSINAWCIQKVGSVGAQLTFAM